MRPNERYNEEAYIYHIPMSYRSTPAINTKFKLNEHQRSILSIQKNHFIYISALSLYIRLYANHNFDAKLGSEPEMRI